MRVSLIPINNCVHGVFFSSWHVLPVPSLPPPRLVPNMVGHLSRVLWPCVLQRQHLLPTKREVKKWRSGADGRAGEVKTVGRTWGFPTVPSMFSCKMGLMCPWTVWCVKLRYDPVATASDEQMAPSQRQKSLFPLHAYSLWPQKHSSVRVSPISIHMPPWSSLPVQCTTGTPVCSSLHGFFFIPEKLKYIMPRSCREELNQTPWC